MKSLRARLSLASALVTFALAAPLLAPGEAQAAASLAACGDIFVEAEASCEVYVEGGCVGRCEPVNFTAACAAELRADCAGQCDAEIDVDCKASCTGGCEAQCEVDPGEFNCQASCQADCGGECSGSCEASGNRAECEASCKATCSASCDGRCNVTPPEADCKARCDASCSGSCEGKAEIDCQIDCQADGYVDCRADMQGGCEVACQRPEGAMFCDGQFINDANLEECVAALQAIFAIEVYVDGSASCEGNTCMAEGEFGCSCTAGGPGDLTAAAMFGLGALLGLRRRRR